MQHKVFTDLVRALSPIQLGNVQFWVDATGPWAGELSHDPGTSEWDLDAIKRDLNSKLSPTSLLYGEKDGEKAIFIGWAEFCDYRRNGWSSTPQNDNVADVLNTMADLTQPDAET